jgi:ribosomal protein S18 acetylase RimI-like enzyme
LELLKKSDVVVLAVDKNIKKVVGFITAITDHVLTAYIPLLEVLPDYQKQQIGKRLTQEMLTLLKEFYMVDLLCDADLQSFYEPLGMRKATGMFIRNYDKQSGTK